MIVEKFDGYIDFISKYKRGSNFFYCFMLEEQDEEDDEESDSSIDKTYKSNQSNNSSELKIMSV